MSWFDQQASTVAQMAAAAAQASRGRGFFTGGSQPAVSIPGGAVNGPSIPGQGSAGSGGFTAAVPTYPSADQTPGLWYPGQPNPTVAQQYPQLGITDPGQGGNKQPGIWIGESQLGQNFLPGEPNPAQTPGAYGTPSGQPWDEQTGLPHDPYTLGQLPTTTPQNGNYQQTYQQIMGGANDQASLLAHQQELEAAGFHISPPNASGAISKIQTPDGQWVRVIGEGEGHPVWIPQDGGTAGASAGSIGGMADGSLLTPWTQQFQAPDPTQIVNDKDYQNQLKQGIHGIQSSAASKGTLLTGGTLKSLDQYGQGLAASFGNTLYNRALGEYQLQKQNFQENQDRPYTKLSGLATLGKPQTIQPPTG